MERILVINPGSTSTKIAVYEDENPLFVKTINHSKEELAPFKEPFDQYEYRRDLVLRTMEENGVTRDTLTAVVSRGGLLPPVRSGAYEINDDMIWQLHYRPENEHASNLGAPIAKSIADELGLKSYVYDPVTVDEMTPIAKVAGLPEMRRKSLGHPLNMRAIAHKYAKDNHTEYEKLTLIVAHLGGGITISLHQNGRMIDLISDGEGPFSPERTGGLSTFQTLKLAAESGKSFKELYNYVKKQGGLMGHLGTNDGREVERRIADGDEHAALVYEAMAHNIAKHVGALATVVRGEVDAILITGGVAHSRMITDWITQRVSFIAPVHVYAGENEGNPWPPVCSGSCGARSRPAPLQRWKICDGDKSGIRRHAVDLRRGGPGGAPLRRVCVRLERVRRPNRGGFPPVERGTAVPHLHHLHGLLLPGRFRRRQSVQANSRAGQRPHLRGPVSGGLLPGLPGQLPAHALCELRRAVRHGLRLCLQLGDEHHDQVVSQQPGAHLRRAADGLWLQQHGAGRPL